MKILGKPGATKAKEKVLKTVKAGANIKSAVIGNEQSNRNPQIDPRVVKAAASDKFRA